LALFPVGKSTLWRWVNAGRFPKPIKLAAGITVWRGADVAAFLADVQEVAA
jgi:predicted DNA-binding transcriptional regulator AlpA